MAKQKGIIKLEGKIGGLSFLKTQDGFLAKEKSGVDGERIKTEAGFVRTRENNAEFTTSANAGKLVRDAVRPLLMLAGDPRVTSRLTQVMSKIKNLDMVSDRGKRSVGEGISDPTGKALLKAFNFNKRASLTSILFGQFETDTATGEISFADLVTSTDLKAPQGATHVSLQSGWARVNFDEGTQDATFSPSIILPVHSPQVNAVSLIPDAEPAGTGTDLFLILVDFFQEVNGQQYALNNGAYSVLAIVEVV